MNTYYRIYDIISADVFSEYRHTSMRLVAVDGEQLPMAGWFYFLCYKGKKRFIDTIAKIVADYDLNKENMLNIVSSQLVTQN